MSTPRMRTIQECIDLIRQDDPQTSFTYYALRKKVLSGEIPSHQVGAKRLINYDKLLEILREPEQEPPAPKMGEIRRVG